MSDWSAGRVTGIAKALYAIDPRSNDAFAAVNRLLAAGEHVTRAVRPFSADRREWPAGTFLVTATGTRTHRRVTELAADLPVVFTAVDTPPIVSQTPLRTPRIGLYQAWGGNIDEGWTRWILEQFAFPYATLRDADIRRGGLRARLDVIVLPDATIESMRSGLAEGTAPPEYVGGMTAQGLANLAAFVRAGGTLVALDSATALPITALNLPLRDVTAPQADSDFSAPGTLVRLDVDPSEPIAMGMPREAAAFVADSSAFDLDDAARLAGARTVAAYARDRVLLSGWLRGEKVIAGRSAVVDVPVGRGRVVLIGFRAQHRAQSHGTFKFLFNALYATWRG